MDEKNMESRQSESITNLMRKLMLAQMEFGVAKRSSDNPFYKSKYADWSEIVAATRPAMAKQALSLMMVPLTMSMGTTKITRNSTTETGESVAEETMYPMRGTGIRATLMDTDSGEWIETSVFMAAQNESPQAAGSALTYMSRYAVRTLTGVVTDDDDDGNAASAIRPQQKPYQHPGLPPEQQEDRRAAISPKLTEPKRPAAVAAERAKKTLITEGQQRRAFAIAAQRAKEILFRGDEGHFLPQLVVRVRGGRVHGRVLFRVINGNQLHAAGLDSARVLRQEKVDFHAFGNELLAQVFAVHAEAAAHERRELPAEHSYAQARHPERNAEALPLPGLLIAITAMTSTVSRRE